MPASALCSAINSKNLVEFYYTDKTPGTRTVEPHMVAYNSKNCLVLSGWFLSGASESNEGPGWREYFLSEIRSVVILQEEFLQPRPGYKPDGGTKFHSVQCAV